MAEKRDQLSRKKFDDFMGDGDDGFDDDISIGSGSRLGGLTGLRPAGKGLGSLGSPIKPSSGQGLGGLPSPAKPKTLGGLGGLSGRPTGGLGGKPKGGLSLKPLVAPKPAAPQPAAPQPVTQQPIDEAFKNLSLKTQGETLEALKNISGFVKGLAEQTLEGFKEVSNRLNQPRDDDSKLQESLDAMVKNIDEEIAAKKDVVYLVVPGSETNTITESEVAKLIKNKSVKVVGSIGQLSF